MINKMTLDVSFFLKKYLYFFTQIIKLLNIRYLYHLQTIAWYPSRKIYKVWYEMMHR